MVVSRLSRCIRPRSNPSLSASSIHTAVAARQIVARVRMPHAVTSAAARSVASEVAAHLRSTHRHAVAVGLLHRADARAALVVGGADGAAGVFADAGVARAEEAGEAVAVEVAAGAAGGAGAFVGGTGGRGGGRAGGAAAALRRVR